MADGLPAGDTIGLISPIEIVWPIGGLVAEKVSVASAAFIREGARKQTRNRTETEHLISCVIDLIIRQEQPTLYLREE